jgi:cystathionine gamma-synthase
MAGFGGVVTFELDADRDGTARFVDSLKIPKLAPSLGGVESLVEQVAIMAYWGVSEEEVERAGVTDSLARLSLGIEETDDIIADLEQALDRT